MKRTIILLFFLFHFSFTNANEKYSYNKYTSATLSLDTAKANKFYKKGLISAKNENYKEAFDYFTKAINSNPNFAEAYLKRAIVRYKAKIYENIWGDYDMAIKLKPDYGEAYYERGRFKGQISGSGLLKRAENEDIKKAKELGYKPF
ncbi:hypothetical protein EZ428_03095 [Pedobacter frigiditerrae]|uniref:Uncharacterized protein n=1 Tax=Pedobacter frigiditerrae TaxID=2530452 RepID=A0A4R0N346_9SPHI|nr:hypothetical protein [Pedobacter frigiditerrae]TCC93773.1 hypothetical protein EZ428_03095 [Pedobacter frigiditerrae]